MTRFLQQRFLRHITILACGLIGFTLLSTTLPLIGTAQADRLFPTITLPTDKSLKCIQPVDEMRRNHMNYIMHQRDLTVHQGIRTETNSLSGCIDCHVEPDHEGNIASFKSNEHFCTTCHEHTAVKIDCFQCHADRPQKYIKRDAQTTSSIRNQLQQVLATAAEDD